MSPVIGIDLGTTNSAVGIWFPQTDEIKIVPNEKNKNTTPSVVYLHPHGQIETGENARHLQLMGNKKNFIYDIKRIIGRPWKDPHVQRYLKSNYFNYSVQKDDIDRAYIVN